jgi:hypothetical protein
MLIAFWTAIGLYTAWALHVTCRTAADAENSLWVYTDGELRWSLVVSAICVAAGSIWPIVELRLWWVARKANERKGGG